VIDSFGGHHGVRDEGLLESALAQPKATSGGKLLHRTVFEQAAAYLFHLSSNHPFFDGNKRIAFAAMLTFRQLNGYRLTMDDDDVYELVMALARGQLTKRQIATALRANTERD
jgi:death on curing protein